MELKMSQEMAIIYQDALFLVLLEIRKACDTLDRGCLLQTMEGYGVGLKLRGIMVEFWRTERWSQDRVDNMPPGSRQPVVPIRGGWN